MSHELYEDVAPVAHVMTCDEMRARIRELAAERDAAIDARLTAERERAAVLERIATQKETIRILQADRGALVADCTAQEKERDEMRAALQVEKEGRDMLVRDGLERLDTIRSLRARIADLTGETAYLSRRVADLLGAGTYETVERALAEARREWAVVAGGAA